MLDKAGNHVEAVFKRVDRWRLRIPDAIDQFVKISPATDHPFGDLSIWMSVETENMDEIAKKLLQATKAVIKRYDGCATLQEEWNVTLHKVYDIQENSCKDDPYGHMEFKIKWTGTKKQ